MGPYTDNFDFSLFCPNSLFFDSRQVSLLLSCLSAGVSCTTEREAGGGTKLWGAQLLRSGVGLSAL